MAIESHIWFKKAGVNDRMMTSSKDFEPHKPSLSLPPEGVTQPSLVRGGVLGLDLLEVIPACGGLLLQRETARAVWKGVTLTRRFRPTESLSPNHGGGK